MEKKPTFIDILEKVQLLKIKASGAGLEMVFWLDTNDFVVKFYADDRPIFHEMATLVEVTPEGVGAFATECNNILDKADRDTDAYIKNLIKDITERTARLEESIRQGAKDLPRTK